MYMLGIKSTLEVDFRLRPNGTTDQIAVKHAPNKDIESAVREDVQNWVVSPPRSNIAAMGEKRQTKIEVSCMAFPSNEEATCTLQAK
jgi:outer membrane biosynthesis protein TonB